MINLTRIKKGFTLIEITIAIAFISILLITIALVTDDIISNYRKGVAMKSINTTGLDLINEFTNTISQAPAANFANLCEDFKSNSDQLAYNNCVNDNAYKFTFQEYKYNVIIKTKRENPENAQSLPAFGAFCTGKYSYLWNTGYTMNNELYYLEDGSSVPKATLRYRYQDQDNTTEISDFRLLKINDPTRMLCTAHIANRKVEEKNDYDENELENSKIFDLTKTIFETDYNLIEEPVELISTKNGGLALYDLTIFRPTQDKVSNRLLYSASMILATVSGGVDILADSDHCTVPDNFKTDFNYCAVNKFNFAMRATGELK